MNHRYTFSIAPKEYLAEIAELRRQLYTKDLGVWFDDGLDEQGVHFLALDEDGRPAAAFRLLGPQNRPFDFESAIDLSTILSEEARPALVGRVFVAPGHRSLKASIKIHGGMTEILRAYVTEQQITDLFLCAHDHRAPYYRGLRFAHTGKSFHHPGWGHLWLMHMPAARLSSAEASPAGSQEPKR